MVLRCAMQEFSECGRCSQAARIAIGACKHGCRRRMSVGRYGGEPGAVAMLCGRICDECLPRARTHGAAVALWLSVDSGRWRVKVGSARPQGAAINKMYVTGLEGTRVVSTIIHDNGLNGTRARQADCVAGVGVSGASRQRA